MGHESRIYILSGPIRSGKTSKVMAWAAERNDVGGCLTPDKDGQRQLYFVAHKGWSPFEVEPDTANSNV